MSHDVFVSYSSKDKAVADAVVAALENSGLRCWVAPRDVKPGADWGDSITNAISACKLVILVFSGHSNKSKHVRDEIYYAISEESIILPFRIENLDPTGSMRLHLSSRHWLDAYQPSWQAHIDRLVGSAADSLGRELVQPAAKEQAPAPAVAAPKASGKQPPWLWIGLAAGAAAVLGAAGLLWSGSRDRQAASPTDAPAVQMPSSTATASPTRAPTPTAETLIVTSLEDSGPGTLRQAIFDAEPGAIITFDPEVFPPDRPTTIFPRNAGSNSALPNLSQGGVTIDASNAGVILDGSNTQGEANGLEIYSDGNTVMGLQVINFGAQGITVCSGSHNVVGGDTDIGSGPLGQGNLIRDNGGFGLDLCNDNTSFNVIRGNVIDSNGTGVVIEAGPRNNVIGPDNVITNNHSGGVEIGSLGANNTITANVIHGNEGPGIWYRIGDAAPYTYSTPPVILHFDLEAGMASGQACTPCVVEIFSTDSEDGKTYEGTVNADDYGLFSLDAGRPFTGPFLTATSSPAGLNTSEFSPATAAVSNIQIALDAMQRAAPVYQTGFDTWEFGPVDGDARVENGKLVLNSERQNVHVPVHERRSGKFAVELELRVLPAGSDWGCYFGTSSDDENQESTKSIGAGFGAVRTGLEYYVHPDLYPLFAQGRYLLSDSYAVSLLYLGDRIAAFVNGELIYTALDPNADTEYARHILSAEGGVTCEYDSYRYWNLAGVDFNP